MSTNQTINIFVKTQGVRQTTRQMTGLQHAIRNVGRSIREASFGIAAIGTALVGASKGIKESADSYINLKNQTKVYAVSQENANYKMQETIRIARKYNTGLNEVGEVLQRISLAQSSQGFSDETAVQMVENLAAATKLSGASAQEAEGALRQFGQGLAANRLSGQELNSVLEQIPLVAMLIADSMGVTTGELRQLGKDGKITAKVLVDALGGEIPKLDEMMKKFTFTFEALLVSIGREASISIGKFMEASGHLKGFQDILADYVIGPMIDLTDVLSSGGPKAAEAIDKITVALGGLAGVAAAGALGTIALLASFITPVGWAVVGLGAALGTAATAMYTFRDSSISVLGVSVSLGDMLVALGKAWVFLAESARDVFLFLPRQAKKALITVASNWDDITSGMEKVFRKMVVSVLQGVLFIKNAFVNVKNFLKNEKFDTIEQVFLKSRAEGELWADELGMKVSNVTKDIIAKLKDMGDSGAEVLKKLAKDSASFLSSFYEEGGRRKLPGIEIEKVGDQGLNPPIPTNRTDESRVRQLLSQYDAIGAVMQKAQRDREIASDLAAKELITQEQYLFIMRQIGAEKEFQLELALQEYRQRQLTLAGADGVLSPTQQLESLKLGADQAFTTIKAQVTDLSSVVKEGLVGSFNLVTDSIVELAITGKANFKQFARSFLQMIQQMIVKLMVMIALQKALQAFGSLFSGPAQATTEATAAGPFSSFLSGGSNSIAGGAAGGFGSYTPGFDATSYLSAPSLTGFASGGPVRGGEPILVGERGPELFVPPKSGSIKNATTTAGMMGGSAPQVTIINVSSQDQVLDTLGSEEAEGLIMNVINANRETIKAF